MSVTAPIPSADLGGTANTTTDPAPDRRKKVHHVVPPRNDGSRESGPTPNHLGTDRRKAVHQSPSAGDAQPAPPDRRKIIHRAPSTRAPAKSPSGIQATLDDARLAGIHRATAMQRVAATLMLLAMLGSTLSTVAPVREDHPETPVESLQEASLVTGLHALYLLAVTGWQALASGDICDDCNLPVDDGCKCLCYSGGYDPDDPACQF